MKNSVFSRLERSLLSLSLYILGAMRVIVRKPHKIKLRQVGPEELEAQAGACYLKEAQTYNEQGKK